MAHWEISTIFCLFWESIALLRAQPPEYCVLPARAVFVYVVQELAVESLEMLDELTMCEVTILTPFVKQIIQFALEVC